MERRRSIGFREVFLIVVLLVGCPRRLSGLSVTVSDVECVYEFVVYEGDTVSGNFVVVDHDIFWSSDHPGIDLIVTSPAGNTVHSLKGTSGDKFEFKAPRAGMYKFCFHNPNRTPETVSFYIHVGHIPNEHDIAKDEHLNPINVKIALLREALESVTAEQRYLKAREVRHHHNIEKPVISSPCNGTSPANKRTRANHGGPMPPAKAGRTTINACVSSFPTVPAYVRSPSAQTTNSAPPAYPYDRPTGHTIYGSRSPLAMRESYGHPVEERNLLTLRSVQHTLRHQ